MPLTDTEETGWRHEVEGRGEEVLEDAILGMPQTRREKTMEPDTRTVWQQQNCRFDIPADCLNLRHGYKDRSSVIIRVDGAGEIYLADCSESRYPDRIIAVTVPFNVFIEAWPEFIKHLQAKVAGAAGGE